MLRALVAVFVIGATPQAPVTSPVVPGSQVSPPAAQSLRATDSVLIAMRAEIDELRRSESRILSLAQWALGCVLTMALALVGFNWWAHRHSANSAQDALRAEAKRFAEEARNSAVGEVSGLLNKIAGQLRQDVSQALSADIMRYQAEAVSIASIREARIRIDIGDLTGAIRAACECYSAAQSGNMNYVAHAFDALFDALSASRRDNVTIPHDDLVAVHSLLLAYKGLHSDPRALRLKAELDALI